MAPILRFARMAGACTLTALLVCAAAAARAQEPSLAEYTHYPLFQTGTVAPRIMVVLDNSGSMNFPAYGDDVEDWPAQKTIPKVYDGKVCGAYSGQVKASWNDGNEQKNTGQIVLCNGVQTPSLLDLDLGRDDDYYGGTSCTKACSCNQAVMAGMLFTGVSVPQQVDGVPVVVSKAYIEFTARANGGPTTAFKSAALTLTITAQANDNPIPIGTANYNISSRPNTAASVIWSIPATAWTDENKYSTPDLKTIVQELINRPGWAPGNAMFFKINAGAEVGGRVAHSFDSNATKAPRLVIEYEPCTVNKYYGYFDNTHSDPTRSKNGESMRYNYVTDRFVRDPNGVWDGNFLNFLCMRRGDILRKALVGGKSTPPATGVNATQIGINEATSTNADFRRYYAGAGVSPYPDAWYFMTNGTIVVRATDSWSGTKLATFNIKVEKDPVDEWAEFGTSGDLAGVLQKVGNRAIWGYTAFLDGSSLTSGKASINYPVGADITTLVTAMKSKPFSTSTPLSEALYVVTQYFKQKDAEVSGYPSNAIGPFDNTRDPYYSKTNVGVLEQCAQGFCILLTDGMSTADARIPTYLQNFSGAGVQSFPSNGSSYARDVALYMRQTDLRSTTVGKNALEKTQNIILYVVYALGNDANARTLLRQCAINGGFQDMNKNNKPDLTAEWDKDGNGIPDTYFEATNGEVLEQELINAVLSILQRSGSGTAVSVLATKGEGEGTLVQAIFNPSTATKLGDVKWTGYLHSLWVDDHGQIREDTVADQKLDTDHDERIVFEVDDVSGDTVVQRLSGEDETPYETAPLEDLRAIWSAGQKLAETDPAFRYIYTYKGDGTEADPNLNFIKLTNNFMGVWGIAKFLGVSNDAAWSYLGVDEVSRAVNLMQWTFGFPDTDDSYYGTVSLRNRTLNDGSLWKLGDIIHSTPTSMAQPLGDYDLLYNDASYYDYYMNNRSRETVVFVGSNDGMLHAFTGWAYSGDQFINPYDVPGYFTNHADTTAGNVDIGGELWAYIPKNILPHLKWLPRKDYTHVNLIDLRPRVFDAKIFTPSTTHPNGWGTVLVCGFGFAGGMQINCNASSSDAAKKATMYPAFFAIDVTDPRAPVFLWERTFPNMGMSSNYPNLMKVGDNWLLAIGSGPTSMDGTSVNSASLVVVDLKTGGNTARGGLKRIFTLPGGSAFANEPVVLDMNMNYNTDAVYCAANYNDGTGEMFRLTVPQKNNTSFKAFEADGTPPIYISDPADLKWTLTKLFKSFLPITSSGTLSVDRKNNAWLYFGTGRYMSLADKSRSDQNYIIGIKDPFFNPDLPTCNYKYPATECEINKLGTVADPLNGLFDADKYKVYSRSEVQGPSGKITFDGLITEARRNVYQGWYRRLQITTGQPSERVINKGAVLGGILLMPTYTPSTDPCGFGGTSRLFGVYYETGTAFFRKVFHDDTSETPTDVISLGDGLASSLSIHSGRQQGGKVYVQKSTGEILEVNVDPAINIKTGPEYWLDDGYY